MAAEPTRLLFPLRTSVELFRDPTSPAASIRAKQGAILFDQIAFERGAFDVTVSTGGSSEFWRPTEHLSDDEIADARQLHEEGAPFAVLMGKQPERGVPAPPEAMRPVIAGEITRHYVAEWESVIRELEPLKPEWAAAFPITDIDLREQGLDRRSASATSRSSASAYALARIIIFATGSTARSTGTRWWLSTRVRSST